MTPPRLTQAIIFALANALAIAMAVACAGGAGDHGRPQVVTTLPLFADFVRQVGGDRVDVSSLMPSGADPHTYEPSPRDVHRVAEADLVFANGLDLEAAVLKIVSANARQGALVLLAEEAARSQFQGFIPGDPHLWMHPSLGTIYAQTVAARLSQADPSGRAQYEANLDRLQNEIEAAETYTRQKLAALPPERRKLITTHSAFAYLALAFGLELGPVVAPGPGQEPSPADVQAISRAIRDQGVPAVFAEPQLDSEDNVLRQAAADAGVQICTLYSDSLDDRVRTYVDLLRFDADEIARCLGGADGE